MNDNIYMLADSEICRKIGKKIRQLRLRQNITQRSLAEQSQISVSSVKKIENGELGTFDTLMRVMRVLGELEIFSPLLKEDEMSPNEYLEFVESVKKKQRKRSSPARKSNITINQEEPEW